MNFISPKFIKVDPSQLKVEMQFYYGDRVRVIKGFYKGLTGRLVAQLIKPQGGPVYALDLDNIGPIEVTPDFLELVARKVKTDQNGKILKIEQGSAS